MAMAQAVAEFHKDKGVDKLFVGMDTHALSTPAHRTTLEVLAANGIKTYYAKKIKKIDAFNFARPPLSGHLLLEVFSGIWLFLNCLYLVIIKYQMNSIIIIIIIIPNSQWTQL